MISSIVKLLIAYPKLADLFFKVQESYVKKTKLERHKRNHDLIDGWVRGTDKANKDSGVHRKAPSPRFFRE